MIKVWKEKRHDTARSGPRANPYSYSYSDAHSDANPHACREAARRLVTSWQIAMLCALPLCLDPVRFRTWAAMLASGLAGYIVSSLYVAPVLAFVMIDVATALVILARPKGLAQQYIGITYVGMICSHIGYAIASNPVAISVYYNMLSAAGWMAWGILLLWGAGDVGKRIGARLGLHWPSFHRKTASRR